MDPFIFHLAGKESKLSPASTAGLLNIIFLLLCFLEPWLQEQLQRRFCRSLQVRLRKTRSFSWKASTSCWLGVRQQWLSIHPMNNQVLLLYDRGVLPLMISRILSSSQRIHSSQYFSTAYLLEEEFGFVFVSDYFHNISACNYKQFGEQRFNQLHVWACLPVKMTGSTLSNIYAFNHSVFILIFCFGITK